MEKLEKNKQTEIRASRGQKNKPQRKEEDQSMESRETATK